MSVSGIIDPTTKKIFPELIGNVSVSQNLGQVLFTGSSANSPLTGLPQDATDFKTLGCEEIETSKVFQGNQPFLQIGEAGDNLVIKGATVKGSILVGSGINTESLPVGANGLVLKANTLASYGVEWAVDGTNGITGISGGTNINIDNTNPLIPIVNFATPTTSNISMGVGTFIEAKDNYSSPNFAMTLDATGFNDIYSSGGVVNQEDIVVSSTSVQQTLSATQTSDYVNSAVLTCDTNFVSDARTSQILTAGLEKTATASITTNVSSSLPLAGFSCGVSAPTTAPYPDIVATISMNCPNTTNPNFSLSQSAPFAPSYLTIIDKDGINQNNSTGAGFNLQTSQDLTLTCPSANKIIVPNGNDIDLSSTTGSVVHTTTYGKDGMESQDFLAGSYASIAQLTQNGGASQMFISSSNLATASNQYLRLEATAGGDMNIEHNATAGRNLSISTNQNLSIGADNIDLSTTGRLIVPSLSSGDYLDYNTGKLTIVNDSVGGTANPLLVLQNNNATAGGVVVETYKNDPPTATGGDVISALSSYTNALVAGVATKVEMTRISSVANGVGTNNNDGSIALACKVNSSLAPQNFLVCNGGVGTGEIVVSKPISSATATNLDLICGTAGGFINLTSVSSVDITATGDNLTTISGANTTLSTTGVGTQIEFKPETSAGKIVFTGASLQSASAGGNSGEHLVIWLNGVKYHIKLELPP